MIVYHTHCKKLLLFYKFQIYFFPIFSFSLCTLLLNIYTLTCQTKKKWTYIQRLRISNKIHITFLLSNPYHRQIQIKMILCRKVQRKFNVQLYLWIGVTPIFAGRYMIRDNMKKNWDDYEMKNNCLSIILCIINFSTSCTYSNRNHIHSSIIPL